MHQEAPCAQRRSIANTLQDGKGAVLTRAEDFWSVLLVFKLFTDNIPRPCLHQGGLLPRTIAPSPQQAFNWEEMKEIESHHFANSNEKTDSGNNHQWMKVLGEGQWGTLGGKDEAPTP